MATNPNDKRKILFVIRSLLRVSLRKTKYAVVVAYDAPCPTHNVYTICILPASGEQFAIDLGTVFQKLVKWTDQYDDDTHTYIHRIRAEGLGTHLQFCFLGVRCDIHIWQVADAVDVNAPGSTKFLFYDGHLEPARKKPPVKKQVHEPEVEDPPLPDDPSMLHPAMSNVIARSHPEQVATILFTLITLLGGSVTVKEMEKLSPEHKGEAFQYLRTFYRNKFFHGKEKTGRRPSFLQQYLSPKKA